MGIPWESTQTRQLSLIFFVSRKKHQKTTMAEIDLTNRDPNSINPHLKVGWEDIFGEPDEIKSMDCVWKNSYKCFECWKSLCYTIMTFCCGICIAAEWGCEFAYIAFTHIWFVSPCFKCLEINCDVARNCTVSASIAAWILGWKLWR